MYSSILYQNMCAIPEFHLNLLLKKRCRGSKLFDIFYNRFKLNCTKYPIFSERLFNYSALRALRRTTCLVRIANHVPFKKMSMKLSKKYRVNCVLHLKIWFISSVVMRFHKQIRFLGTQCIFLTRSCIIHNIRLSLTKKCYYCENSTHLGK